MEQGVHGRKYSAILMLSALGIVYGDIGTSPLYALRECFSGHSPVPLTPANVFGILSLIFWVFIVVISIKYVTFVMRADNQGEGGELALMALALRSRSKKSPFLKPIIVSGGLFGGALLYGDSILTSSISVLSAVEGLKVATPLFEPYVVAITCVIIAMLFSLQRLGTGKIGIFFGPIIVVWFATIAILGIGGIKLHPEILWALLPHHGAIFFLDNGFLGFAVLGSVFLVVTGGEALYADMGHFGLKAIRRGWFYVAFPCLMLNYLGQGGLLIHDPANLVNPFYRLAPDWGIYPLVILAAMATVIASQAVITGAFSITRQAVQLGYLPRLRIDQTSSREIGQIYVPLISWILFIFTIAFVLIFRTSSNIAAAYGTAVSATMVITTVLTFFVTRFVWRWSLALSLIVTVPLVAIDLVFFSANMLKIAEGGWIPLAIGIVIFTLMITWHTGRNILADRLQEQTIPLDKFFNELRRKAPVRVPGIAVFLVRNTQGTPPALVHNLEHNKVVHQAVMFVTVTTERVPIVPAEDRLEVQDLQNGFYRVILRYGFSESPDVPYELQRVHLPHFEFNISDITFFVGRETILASDRPGMAKWREAIFAFLSQNAHRATAFYRLPPERVIEIGLIVEM